MSEQELVNNILFFLCFYVVYFLKFRVSINFN